jgi:hypothetical protein
MRMVIDSNFLKDPALRDYLARSRKNVVVLTDYLMIEALKGDTLAKIFNLMKIMSEYPDQVAVLKSMRSVSQLKGRRCGITRRMIEPGQTKGFEDWCIGLSKAEMGDETYRRELVKNGREATAQMERIIAHQASYAEVIANEAKNYTADELRILKKDQPYTPEMENKLAERIVSLTGRFLDLHPDEVKPPTASELSYTFMFRFALCAYLQTLERIREGGATGIKAEKVANDVVDATFATYATYFQGLLSNDAKANDLYRKAKQILKGFSNCARRFEKDRR